MAASFILSTRSSLSVICDIFLGFDTPIQATANCSGSAALQPASAYHFYHHHLISEFCYLPRVNKHVVPSQHCSQWGSILPTFGKSHLPMTCPYCLQLACHGLQTMYKCLYSTSNLS